MKPRHIAIKTRLIAGIATTFLLTLSLGASGYFGSTLAALIALLMPVLLVQHVRRPLARTGETGARVAAGRLSMSAPARKTLATARAVRAETEAWAAF